MGSWHWNYKRENPLRHLFHVELNFTVFQKVYLPSNLTFFTNYPITSGSKQDDAHFENKKVEKLRRVKTCNSVKGNYEKSSRLWNRGT